MVDSLPECVQSWVTENVSLSGRELQLTIPAEPDRLLDDPKVLEENRRNDYVPYWAYLWPAARSFANLLAHLETPPDSSLLEIGCGSGLAGLAALARNWQVTFSDYRQEALDLASWNARQNDFDNFELLQLDWFSPPEDRKWKWIIASDVLYEARFHEPFLETMDKLLADDGQIWIGDPGRALVLEFVRKAQVRNWEPDVYDENFERRSFPSIGHFQLLVFSRG